MTYPNKEFHFQQTGASPAAGTAGYGISILDACLVTGFNTKNIQSISVTTNIATATTSTTHGFVPDEIVLISGANESVFNTEFKVLSTPTTTSFTFALTTGLSSASGTMTVKFAPLGWEKVFTGTNKAVYRSQDVTGTRLYLRVDDSNAQYMTLNMYETMSSVDAGTGMSTTLYWNKSSTANTTARNWYLIGNSKVFYILIFWHASYLNAALPLSFGDFISCKPGDAYNCMLNAYTLAASNTPWDNCSMTSLNVVEVTGQFIARSYAQMGSNIQFYKRAGCAGTGFGVLNDVSFPNPADNGIHLTPVYIYENTTTKVYRGIMPGLFVPFETTNMAFLNRDKSIIPNGKQYVGYITAKAGNYGNCWFNLDEAWE